MGNDNVYSLLNDTIDFAQKQLQDFESEKGLTDSKSEVLASLLRSIIELSDGVKVSAENGIRASSELNYRGFLEAYVAYKYILNDPEKIVERAGAYKVGYHLQIIETAKEAIQNAETIGINVQAMNDEIQKNTDIINQPELKAILDEFEILKGRYYSKWYSLFGGPTSLKQLVQGLDDTQLMYSIYGSLSKNAHNYIALRALTPNGLQPVRVGFNPDIDTNNLNVICTFLLSSIIRFTNSIYPEYKSKLEPFVEHYIETKKNLGIIQ